MPWFDKVGSPEGIISFIESGAAEDTNIIVGFPPALRNIYLGSVIYILTRLILRKNRCYRFLNSIRG